MRLVEGVSEDDSLFGGSVSGSDPLDDFFGMRLEDDDWEDATCACCGNRSISASRCEANSSMFFPHSRSKFVGIAFLGVLRSDSFVCCKLSRRSFSFFGHSLSN